MQMKHCTNCGEQLEDQLEFCTSCGEKQEVAIEQEASKEEALVQEDLEVVEEVVATSKTAEEKQASSMNEKIDFSQIKDKINADEIKDRLKPLLANKKLLMGAGAIAALLIIVMIGFSLMGGSQFTRPILTVEDGDTYAFINGKPEKILKNSGYISYDSRCFETSSAIVIEYDENLVIYDKKKDDTLEYEYPTNYVFSHDFSRIMCQNNDNELMLVSINNIDKEEEIIDDIDSFAVTKDFKRIFVVNDDDELIEINHKGEEINSIDKDIYEIFPILGNRYLIYETYDESIVYDLKTNEELEDFSQEVSRVYQATKDGSGYILLSDDSVRWIHNGDIERVAKNVYGLYSNYHWLDVDKAISYEDIFIYSSVDDSEAFFNDKGEVLEADNTLGHDYYYKLKDDEITFYDMHFNEVAEFEAEEDIDYVLGSAPNNVILSYDDDVYHYNGKDLEKLKIDADDINYSSVTRNGTIYLAEEDKIYLVKNRKLVELYDGEDIYDLDFSYFDNKITFYNDDDEVYVIHDGRQAKMIAEDVSQYQFSYIQRRAFVTIDDVLFYVNGDKLVEIGEDHQVLN